MFHQSSIKDGRLSEKRSAMIHVAEHKRSLKDASMFAVREVRSAFTAGPRST